MEHSEGNFEYAMVLTGDFSHFQIKLQSCKVYECEGGNYAFEIKRKNYYACAEGIYAYLRATPSAVYFCTKKRFSKAV